MNTANFPRNKARKIEEAAARAAETAKLSPQERLARLDNRLGVGMGATKERSKLLTMVGVQITADVVEELIVEEAAQPTEKVKLKAKDRRAAQQKQQKKNVVELED